MVFFPQLKAQQLAILVILDFFMKFQYHSSNQISMEAWIGHHEKDIVAQKHNRSQLIMNIHEYIIDHEQA